MDIEVAFFSMISFVEKVDQQDEQHNGKDINQIEHTAHRHLQLP